MLKQYRNAIKNKNILYELIGNTFSRFGDGIDTIAFSILVYRITGSTLLVASVFAVNGLPNILFSIFSGIVSTKHDEKKVVWICDFVRAFFVSIVAILYVMNCLETWHLFVITFINSSVETFRAPASTGLLSRIVMTEEMDIVLSLKTTCEKIAEIIGLVMAPLVCTFLGLQFALLIDAVTFCICATSICFISISSKAFQGEQKTAELLKEGLLYLRGNRPLMGSLIFTMVVNIMFVPINVFQVPLIEKELELSDYYLSVICVVVSLSMALGSAVFPVVKSKVSNIVLFRMAGFGMAVSYFILFLSQYFNVYGKTIGIVISMLLLGVGIAQISIMMQSLFFDVVEDAYIPRMGAVSAMAAYCVTPLFSTLFGGLSEFMPVLNIFLICACSAMLLFPFSGGFLYGKGLEEEEL